VQRFDADSTRETRDLENEVECGVNDEPRFARLRCWWYGRFKIVLASWRVPITTINGQGSGTCERDFARSDTWEPTYICDIQQEQRLSERETIEKVLQHDGVV
jgi:hypothetical protein